MKENFARGLAVTRWAVAHWPEWEIVCGLRPASAERNWEVFEMLQKAGLEELVQVMAARIYTMVLEELENGEQAEAGKKA